MGSWAGTSTPGQGAAVRYPGLDLVRLLAFVMVLSLHLGTEGTVHIPEWITFFRPSGEHGVDLFFVLSGYLVYGNLLRQFRDSTADGTTTLAFWLRRASRTFGPYWLMVILLKLGSPLFDDRGIPSDWSVFPYFAYLQNYAFPTPYPFIHAWSLCAEELFYFLAPLVTFLLLRKVQTTWVKVLFVLSVVFFSPFCVATRWVNFDDAPMRREVLYFTPHYRLFGLMAGCLLAALRESDDPIAARIRSFLHEQRRGLFALGAAVFALILYGPRAYAYESLGRLLLTEVAFCLSVVITFPFLESWKVEANQRRWYVRVLEFLAVRVYAAYLVHPIVLWVQHRLQECHPIPGMSGCHSYVPREPGYFMLIAIGGTVLGTMLLYGLVEHPLVNLGSRAIRKLKTRTVREAPEPAPIPAME